MNIRTASDGIKQAVPMREVCEMYGIRIGRNGNALCPFHADTNASMHIYPGNRGWHCFSCGKGGSVIDFVMELKGLSFPDAVREMNEVFNLGYQIDGYKGTPDPDAVRRAEQARAERERKARRLAAARDLYDKALTEWTQLDRIITQNRPKTPDQMTPEWTDAMVQIQAATERLRQAEMILMEIEQE